MTGKENETGTSTTTPAAAQPKTPATRTGSTVPPSSSQLQERQDPSVYSESVASKPFAATPASHSKVLRQHLESTAKRRHRLLASGAVRLPNQPTSDQEPIFHDRIGYDGSYKTPSKQLLRSTNASRHQRIQSLQRLSSLEARDRKRSPDEVQRTQKLTQSSNPHPSLVANNASNEDPNNTTMSSGSVSLSVDLMNVPHEYVLDSRMGCTNPVSKTLMNHDGTEDWKFLTIADPNSDILGMNIVGGDARSASSPSSLDEISNGPNRNESDLEVNGIQSLSLAERHTSLSDLSGKSSPAFVHVEPPNADHVARPLAKRPKRPPPY